MTSSDDLLETLGPWTARPSSNFAIGSATPTIDPLVWRISVSGDPNDAQDEFDTGQFTLQALEARLALVPARLQSVLPLGGHPKSPSSSFGFGPGTVPLPEAEREILKTLAPARGSVSFSVGETATAQTESSRLEQMLARMLERLTRYTLIETRVDEHLVGSSRVALAGDFASSFSPDLSLAQAALHQRAVALALKSRDAWLRIALLTMGSAIKVAGTLSTPMGAVIALPAAWSFVRNVMAEIHALNAAPGK